VSSLHIVLKAHGIQFALGFMKPTPALPFGSTSSFGSPGAGGAMGFADPAEGIGYGYRDERDRNPAEIHGMFLPGGP
jgi:hypothetical protein